jgi:hypothetical protein
MAQIATDGGTIGSSGKLSVVMALRIASVIWILLLVVPFFMFLAVVYKLGVQGAEHMQVQNDRWFLGASAYLLVVVPASFFWRGHLFKAYWTGRPIAPANYLFGMISVWVALEVGGLLSLSGSIMSGSLLPSLLPALVAFMFYVTLWPSGRSMVRRVGNSEDPHVYEEPR